MHFGDSTALCSLSVPPFPADSLSPMPLCSICASYKPEVNQGTDLAEKQLLLFLKQFPDPAHW